MKPWYFVRPAVGTPNTWVVIRLDENPNEAAAAVPGVVILNYRHEDDARAVAEMLNMCAEGEIR